ncbi:MAG: hypothetical protein C5B52_07655 [Bacteroidetes bacterium]|nr:MAG: hypothetical protein C5B52_07655 [Bacteroidota bacterium]
MQVYGNSNKVSIKILSAILVTLVVAYLPVSSFHFVLKNDSFTGYFPPKFFISESLHASYLPLWDPYLNYGFPIYADMSAGFWNPITWLVAGTFGYNAYTYTLEELFYILISGIGMFYLTSYWKIVKPVRFISAISYMCCGYFVGHLQHLNWLEGAAFLPWTFFGYLLCLQRFSLKRILFAGLSFYMLLVSAHPGLIIAAFYFILSFGIGKIYVGYKSGKVQFLKKFLLSNSVLIFTILLLSLGLIISYSEIIPFITRGEKLAPGAAQAEPTTIESWISFVFPFAVSQNFPFQHLFHNDHTVRNCYIGLVMLLFLMLALVSQKNRWQYFFLITGFAFLLLSAGGIIKTFAYKWVPLIGYVRINGEFRIISLFCFILAGTIALNNHIRNGWKYDWKLRAVLNAVYVVLILTILGCTIIIIYTNESIFYDLRAQSNGESITSFLKKGIDTFSIYDCFLIQGILQLIFWSLIYRGINRRKLNLLVYACVLDLIFATLMNIPYTGVSKSTVKEFQSIIDRSPKNIPIPKLQPVTMNAMESPAVERMIGPWGWYNKQIGSVEEIAYPIAFKSTKKFFNSDLKDSADMKPYAFLENNPEASTILVKHFSPTVMDFSVSSTKNSGFILKQNIYKGWTCRVDNQTVSIDTALITFMKCQLTQGSHEIKFEFKRPVISWSLWFNFALVIVGFAFITYTIIRNRLLTL